MMIMMMVMMMMVMIMMMMMMMMIIANDDKLERKRKVPWPDSTFARRECSQKQDRKLTE